MDAKGKDHGLLIHPDDIDFDLLTGEVIILGPKTPEEREMVQMAREAVQYSKTLLREACADLREHPRRTSIQKLIDSLVRSIKLCNEMLPKRYQVDAKAVLDEEEGKVGSGGVTPDEQQPHQS